MSWSNVAVDPLDAVLGTPSCSNQGPLTGLPGNTSDHFFLCCFTKYRRSWSCLRLEAFLSASLSS